MVVADVVSVAVHQQPPDRRAVGGQQGGANAVGAVSPRGHGRFRIGALGARDDLLFCGQQKTNTTPAPGKINTRTTRTKRYCPAPGGTPANITVLAHGTLMQVERADNISLAVPVIGDVLRQDMKTWHMQQVVNAAPTPNRLCGIRHNRFCESRGCDSPRPLTSPHLVVLVHGTRADAETLREGSLRCSRLWACGCRRPRPRSCTSATGSISSASASSGNASGERTNGTPTPSSPAGRSGR